MNRLDVGHEDRGSQQAQDQDKENIQTRKELNIAPSIKPLQDANTD
jgi:hypothetical protein